MLDRTKKLSEHFTLGELTNTQYKTSDGNEPPLEAVENLISICQFWLEELRAIYNRSYVKEEKEEGIIINQGFRSYQVMMEMMKAGLNPSKTSNHMRGCAVDIRCKDKQQAYRYMMILKRMSEKNGKDFDELFLERSGTTYWVHFAVRPSNNRKKIRYLLG
ncbi:MAG: hypothetical protein J6U14_00895 [Bacteroidaceae bacterium]|nr:hypothetical protein [Bacteroidaceae bacterium]